MRPIVCDRSRAWISLRLDGEISQFESVLLRAHMGICRDCRRFATDVAWQADALRNAPLEPVTRPITIPGRAWSRRAVEWGTAATAAVAASIALVVGIGGSPSRPAFQPLRAPSSSEIGFDSESLGLPHASALDRKPGVAIARGRRALPQL